METRLVVMAGRQKGAIMTRLMPGCGSVGRDPPGARSVDRQVQRARPSPLVLSVTSLQIVAGGRTDKH